MSDFPFATYVLYKDRPQSGKDVKKTEPEVNKLTLDENKTSKEPPEFSWKGLKKSSFVPIPPIGGSPESVLVQEYKDVMEHTLLNFKFDLGLTVTSIGVTVTYSPDSAVLSLLCSDIPPSSPLDYRWEITLGPLVTQGPHMYIGAVGSKLFLAVQPSDKLDLLHIEVWTGIPIHLKDDLQKPWKILQSYNYSHVEEHYLSQWFEENDTTVPVDEEGRTPLISACCCPNKGNLRLVQTLMEKYNKTFDPNHKDNYGLSALHYLSQVEDNFGNKRDIIYRRQCQLMQYLLDNCKISLEVRDDFGNTPCHWAAATDSESEILKLILDHRGKPSVINSDGHTPTDVAMLAHFNHNANLICQYTNEKIPTLTDVKMKSNRQIRRVSAHEADHLLLPHHVDNVGRLILTEDKLREVFDKLDYEGNGWVTMDQIKDWHKKEYCPDSTGDDDIDGIHSTLRLFHPVTLGKVTYNEFSMIVLRAAQR